MQSEFMNGYKKIIQICQKTGILHVGSTDNARQTIQYGPLGSLLRKNIFREWLFSFIKNHDMPAFPLEFQNPREKSNLFQKASDSPDCELLDVIDSYVKVLPMNGCVLPFGIASYGSCINKTNAQSSFNAHSSLFRNLESFYQLSWVVFSPSQKSNDWFHYWSKYRYRWWRKFSNIPSKFTLSDVSETSGKQQLSLMLEYPWGKEKIETITHYEDKYLKKLCSKYGLEHKISNFTVPSIISCDTELDLAFLAYVHNSFSEKQRENEIQEIFHFHVKLAPFKACLSLTACKDDALQKLSNVANHLMKELKNANIIVFPYFDAVKFEETQKQFAKFDAMGIPYSVLLNESTLLTGVAGLRNRDTTLQEEVHLTELTLKLQRYLQVTVQTTSQEN